MVSAAVGLGVYSGPKSQPWKQLCEALCKYAIICSLALKGTTEADRNVIRFGSTVQVKSLT